MVPPCPLCVPQSDKVQDRPGLHDRAPSRPPPFRKFNRRDPAPVCGVRSDLTSFPLLLRVRRRRPPPPSSPLRYRHWCSVRRSGSRLSSELASNQIEQEQQQGPHFLSSTGTVLSIQQPNVPSPFPEQTTAKQLSMSAIRTSAASHFLFSL